MDWAARPLGALAHRLGLGEDAIHELLAEANRKVRRSSRRLADAER